MLKNSQSKGMTVLLVATSINFLSGILYIWSIVSKGLIKEYHWTSTQASLPYTVCTVSFALAMVIAGRLQDSKGPSLCSTVGGILIGAGLILSSFTHEPLVIMVTFGVLVGSGIGFVNSSTTPPSVKWFTTEKKGMVSGIVVGGIAFASVVYSPLINWLTGTYGISKAFLFLGIVVLVLITIASQFLHNPPKGYIPKADASAITDTKKVSVMKETKEYTVKEMVKTKEFYKFWIMLAFSSSAGLMIIGHIANIAKMQVHWENGYLLVILLAVFNTLGRFLGGTVSDKIGRINIMRIIFLLQALNMAFFSTYRTTVILAVGVAIAGLCYGATFSVFPSAIADYYGIKNMGANYGLVFTAWGLGGVIGPLTAASIMDSMGNYNNAYIISMALLIVSFVISLTYKKNQAVVSESALEF